MPRAKSILAFIVALAAVTLLTQSCKEEQNYHDYLDQSQLDVIAQIGKTHPSVQDHHLDLDTNWKDANGDHHILIDPLPDSYDSIFVDYNAVQIPYAEKNGIEPIRNFHDAYRLRQPLVRIETCEAYYLDSLTHSMPFLVPKAAKLLEDIGCAFADSVMAHGGSQYRIVVTSCTRSLYTVSKLLRVNRNATPRSCHMYGTTFDLSWTHYEPYNNDYRINREDLKNILGHVLLDFRNKNRCTVLHEKGQCCFHITVK